MFVFAIETCGKTVAFTKETDRIMLDGILGGERGEGQQMHSMLARIKTWDSVSPLTARLATESEELDCGIVTNEPGITDDESVIVYQIEAANGEIFLEIEPALLRVA
ncbi:MAG TPA: hypothetical protein VHQ48_02100 [Bradyrhizobium sp.]|jgi:hypothetical protein|nr:hypothetical protein [Bradyrhizobium sp.]